MWYACVKWTIRPIIFLSTFIGSAPGLFSQDFGRNKVHYDTKDFRIRETPHFEIYHYLKNDSIVNHWALEAEKWYGIHQEIFRDTFKTRNPLILY
ncbi:MAG TPA: hypothetical protein VI583_00790, partial [Cyclobacteriaceae bacterium]|nr:hypothetical protein [Cyclobacteriaceae bacterium]